MILFLALSVSLSCGMIDASTENLAGTLQNSDTTKSSRVPKEAHLHAKTSPTKSRRQSHRNFTLTRQIAIKQGILRGVVRHMHPQSGLRDVDQFLGIPYAEPPINSKRFMPPGAPLPWSDVRIFAELPPVCPQNLPNLQAANGTLSKGRYNQLKRLLPYLKSEREDCLFLNIYIPTWEGSIFQAKFPVLVFIHGESFEWNSGNPYDGSVLASYGRVIVITVNYRLGILGFMRPGVEDQTVSNFGLLDQIAALQWIKENIEAFGGDSSSVTLMGHSTGAACVNFLMVSQVAKGLFHRAILMSGSALSDWATSKHPTQYTMKVAQSVNCPITDEELVACLRRKRYTEMLRAKVSSPKFSTVFGPLIDGLVIPNDPTSIMSQSTDTFSKYDLLFGMTEVESYHMLNAMELMYGLLETERDTLLRFYLQNRFEIRPDLALAATLKEYSNIYSTEKTQNANYHRDKILEIFSDARVAGPLVQTGLFHAKSNPRSFMYVFAHNTEAGEYAYLSQSIIGEELAYVFGAPLNPSGVFQPFYNSQERLLSEAVMKYWTNFVKTGNPKAPWRDRFLNANPIEWARFDIDWPEYNQINQSYLHLNSHPVVGHQYRHIFMRFWNQNLPSELHKLTIAKSNVHMMPLNIPSPEAPRREIYGNFSTHPRYFGGGEVKTYPDERMFSKTDDPISILRLLSKSTRPSPEISVATEERMSTELANVTPFDPDSYTPNSANLTLNLLIIIVVILSILIVIFGYILKRSYKRTSPTEKILKNMKRSTPPKMFYRSDNDLSEISNNSYDMVRIERGSKVDSIHSDGINYPTTVIKAPWRTLPKRCSFEDPENHSDCFTKPGQVSVAIDATPQARSGSVLKQEPIEVTKSRILLTPETKIICQELENPTLSAYYGDDLCEEEDYLRQPPENHITTLGNGHVRNFSDSQKCTELVSTSARGTNSLDSTKMRRRSLPAQNQLDFAMGWVKVPPVPPPRTVSTLSRRHNLPVPEENLPHPPRHMLATLPPSDQEEVITSNTLIVGPLIPSKGAKGKSSDATDDGEAAELCGTSSTTKYNALSRSRKKSTTRNEPNIIIKPSISRSTSEKTNKFSVRRTPASATIISPAASGEMPN
ncbi:neuroligin-4, X-linked [Phlebotomus argentipes]|uniref:neuroligin-4, X-linked n=1 Tax=Phlebotomus argentipes TaxID=94469 RepID=UPI00289324C0|nr:neuroligin-4, X-linked [Phlebotomus argentipes]